MRERLRGLLFVKAGKEQDMKCVFNDCTVMAICKNHDTDETSAFGRNRGEGF